MATMQAVEQVKIPGTKPAAKKRWWWCLPANGDDACREQVKIRNEARGEE